MMSIVQGGTVQCLQCAGSAAVASSRVPEACQSCCILVNSKIRRQLDELPLSTSCTQSRAMLDLASAAESTTVPGPARLRTSHWALQPCAHCYKPIWNRYDVTILMGVTGVKASCSDEEDVRFSIKQMYQIPQDLQWQPLNSIRISSDSCSRAQAILNVEQHLAVTLPGTRAREKSRCWRL